ncbi:hypothetical protein [Hydrocoleum sp. CS-953]|uniref:hypothetical protein n=1 Tax=Microcoleaceae TaxID=1892252 RepID=UPI000B9C3DA7|nr:hypothetical protein [Hydrocoleum sp. CS-953]OZH55305.1 hypothetical protein AFK68_05495 [Hydrocoleum sp. CS-953]
MLFNKNIRTTENHPINSESVAKRAENPANSSKKQSKSCLHMIWLKDENGNLTAHWTTQD